MLSRQDWQQIGAVAIRTVRDRIRGARNAEDGPAKALSKPYAERKRRIGKPAERNLEFSGLLLGSVSVVAVQPDSVSIGFARLDEQRKMSWNERHEHMWGFSRQDQEKIERFALARLDQRLREAGL